MATQRARTNVAQALSLTRVASSPGAPLSHFFRSRASLARQ